MSVPVIVYIKCQVIACQLSGVRSQVSGIRCQVYTFQGQVINMSISGKLQYHMSGNHPVIQHDTGEQHSYTFQTLHNHIYNNNKLIYFIYAEPSEAGVYLGIRIISMIPVQCVIITVNKCSYNMLILENHSHIIYHLA